MMFSCKTFLLKRRRAFSTVSPSWSFTSAHAHLHPAPIFRMASFCLCRGGGASSGIGGVWCCASFSVSSLLGLKPASRLAVMVMVSPVRGLRPWRSFLSFTTKLPNPRRSTRSFARSASAIIARTESTATSTSDFFNSVLAATFSINCCFVILFEFSGCSRKTQPAVPGTDGRPLRRRHPPVGVFSVQQAAIIVIMLRLSDTLKRSLLTEPETGMGYQRVEATLRDNKTERGIAFNAELLVLDDETQVTRRMYPNTNPYTILLKGCAQCTGNEIKALRVLPRAGMVFRAIEKKAAPAEDASKSV